MLDMDANTDFTCNSYLKMPAAGCPTPRNTDFNVLDNTLSRGLHREAFMPD
jgi:hypothetical protein